MRPSRLATWALALGLLGGCDAQRRLLPDDERPVALVAGEPVPRGLYDAFTYDNFATYLEGEPTNTVVGDEVHSRLFDRFIDEQILLSQARLAGVTVSDQELEEYVEGLGLGPLEHLHENATFVQRKWLHQYLEDTLRVQKFLEQTVTAGISVSDEDLRQAFEADQQRHSQPTLYRIGLIRVESLRESRGIKRRLRSDGSNFEELASEIENVNDAGADLEQQGRDLGLWRLDELPQAFAEAIEELEPGRVAGPVRDPDEGYNWIKLLERVEGGLPEFEQVRERVRVKLLNERAAERMNEYLIQANQRVVVEIIHDNLPFRYTPAGSSEPAASGPDGTTLGESS